MNLNFCKKLSNAIKSNSLSCCLSTLAHSFNSLLPKFEEQLIYWVEHLVPAGFYICRVTLYLEDIGFVYKSIGHKF
jgi:hypothetical protein